MFKNFRASCLRLIVFSLVVVVLAAGFVNAQRRPAASETPSPAKESDPLKALQWRSIGPFRGGRSTAVAGVASQPMVYYFGGTGGGVWKTTDGGINWEPITDGSVFGTGSVGAIGLSDSDPNTIYVGMGESAIRGNVSHGDGVYKSIDAGKTWKRLGLEDTRQISRIRVHPKNPDIVYVAAQGHVWGPNEQRGVFRSKDGGKTWEKVLYRSDKAGACDLIIDPSNSNNLYAGFWEVYRKPWTLESGGAGSGIFKSSDGGDTWTEITRNPGLPKGTIGIVGITVSAANSDRLWAIVEAEDGGVFRSENGGKNWTRVNEERRLRQRAWYYSRIYADPKSADTVYVLNTGFYKSNDGGKTFTGIGVPHGDNHDLWIAPDDSNRMINSNDGGANVSFNGGKSWSEQDQPTAQFYRVALDNDFPYHIYGAQQDNSTVRIASRTTEGGITTGDWYDVGGGESGWIAPLPRDSEIVFAGSYGGLITRYDHHTGQQRDINPYPNNPMGAGADVLKYRFQWNFPIVFSTHDSSPSGTLYAGANVLFKSRNEGQSWEVISPDLTRDDKSKQASSGGPITKDNTSIEYYDTIFTVMESPVQAGTIWSGSDDGLVYLTRDAGQSWTKVTPPKEIMPEWIQINSIEASPFDAATAYVAATMYKSDDNRPYLYKTADYGKTWKKITNGIPDGAFTRVIREDPNKRGLLFAGTETGLYVSFDDGAEWQPFQSNLPIVPIADLAIHKREQELVAATQGRSFWIFDDLPLLHQLMDAGRNGRKETRLFKPKDSLRMPGGGGFPLPATATVGKNPAGGAVVYYYLKAKPTSEVVLEILDANGKSIRKYTAPAPPKPGPAAGAAPGPTPATTPAPAAEEGDFFGGGAAARVPTEVGLNRFVWDLRYADAVRFPGMILWAGETRGPRIVPGNYQVKLTVDGQTMTEGFTVNPDPRLQTTAADYAKQLELGLKIRNKLTETHNAIIEIRDVRKQVDDLMKRVKDQPGAKVINDVGTTLNKSLTTIEEALYQTKNQSSQDPLNFPIRLNNKLAALGGVVYAAEYAPSDQSYVVYDELVAQIDAQLLKLARLMKTDVPSFNQLVRDQNIPAVLVKPPAVESHSP
ncbi:MAG: glycosyl hydrolase, repeat-containing protein [Acidobacteria bacterium]|nr:glycosyl hydrolase, repeat-containing protein [Acidobacteriota bacterium]